VRSSYLAVLRLPHARPLLLASLVGRLANATGPLSVVLFVQEQTGSLAQAGAASAAIGLASGLLAPVRGRLVDRYGQRRCLLPMGLGFAAALAGMVAAAGPGPAAVATTIALAAAAGAVAPPLGASMRALWVSLAGQGPRLQTAYALDAVLDELLFVLGPLLAGGLATLYRPAAGVLATAGLALVGTLGFVASPVSRAQAGRPAAVGGRAGWAGAMAAPGLRTLVLSLTGVGAAIGIWEIGLVGAAREAGSPEAASISLAA
jgi:MFS family permease